MKKLNLADATDAQMRVFAREVLGLEDADSAAIKPLRVKITAAWPHDHIVMADDPPAPHAVAEATEPPPLTKEQIEAKAGPGISASSSKIDPVVDLIIQERDTPDGKDPVYVNVNGMAMHIARKRPQAVPWRYFQVLKGTVQRLYTQDDKTMVITHQDVPRFPYSLCLNGRFPTPDQIFEWEREDARRSGQDFTRDQFDARMAREAELQAASDAA